MTTRKRSLCSNGANSDLNIIHVSGQLAFIECAICQRYSGLPLDASRIGLVDLGDFELDHYRNANLPPTTQSLRSHCIVLAFYVVFYFIKYTAFHWSTNRRISDFFKDLSIQTRLNGLYNYASNGKQLYGLTEGRAE